jgi:CO/xanthine dehydrogenase FAD-binding subunit
MVAVDATLKIESVRGTRHVPARSFFRDALATDLAPDEILTEVRVPVARPSARFSFRELSRRHGDFAIVAVAVHFDPPHPTSRSAQVLSRSRASAPGLGKRCARAACPHCR